MTDWEFLCSVYYLSCRGSPPKSEPVVERRKVTRRENNIVGTTKTNTVNLVQKKSCLWADLSGGSGFNILILKGGIGRSCLVRAG